MNLNLNFVVCLVLALLGGFAYAALSKAPPDRPALRETARAVLWAGLFGCVIIVAGASLPRLR